MDKKVVEREFGTTTQLSHPELNGARHLLVYEVNLPIGLGHNFHVHPEQEEFIYVLEGEVEQWLDTTKTFLKQGDSVLVPANTVHASFNTAPQPTRLLVAFHALSLGKEDVPTREVGTQTPWNTLRP